MKHICLSLIILFATSSLRAQLVRDIIKEKVERRSTGHSEIVPLAPAAVGSPIIKKVSPAAFSEIDTILINGENLKTLEELSYDGQEVKEILNQTDSDIKVVVGQKSKDGSQFLLKTAAGSVYYPEKTGSEKRGERERNVDTIDQTIPEASADFTLPDVGQSNLNIILTPTFLLKRIYNSGNSRFGVSGSFWGNTFGVDSLKEKIGLKFLLPQSSMIGMKFEFAYAFLKEKPEIFSLSLVVEANMLFKKVAFLDTATRGTNSFNPFTFHFKPGIAASFFNANILLSAYLNILSVQTEVDKFKVFFNTSSKTTFAYPEIDLSGIFDVGESSNQSVKVGFDFLFNNNNARYFTGSTDKIIPYMRVGLVSKL